MIAKGKVVGGQDVSPFTGLPAPDPEGKSVEDDDFRSTGLAGFLGGRGEGDLGKGMEGLARSGGSPLFQKLMDLPGGDFAAFQLAAEKLVGVAETLKKRGKKGSQGAGIGKKKVVKLLHVHDMKAGGLQGPGGGGARLIVEKRHLPENIARNQVAQGDVPLAPDVNGDFNPALENAKRLGALISLAKDDLSLGESLFAHERKG